MSKSKEKNGLSIFNIDVAGMGIMTRLLESLHDIKQIKNGMIKNPSMHVRFAEAVPTQYTTTGKEIVGRLGSLLGNIFVALQAICRLSTGYLGSYYFETDQLYPFNDVFLYY